jgi:hypothetical protein
MRAFFLALTLSFTVGCAGHNATADIVSGGEAQEDASSRAFVWQPHGAEATEDAFILVVTRGVAVKGETQTQSRLTVKEGYTKLASALGYDARKVGEDDFRHNYPVMNVDQLVDPSNPSADNVHLTYRNPGHRAIVRLYVETMVAEVSGVAEVDNAFSKTLLKTAL